MNISVVIFSLYVNKVKQYCLGQVFNIVLTLDICMNVTVYFLYPSYICEIKTVFNIVMIFVICMYFKKLAEKNI